MCVFTQKNKYEDTYYTQFKNINKPVNLNRGIKQIVLHINYIASTVMVHFNDKSFIYEKNDDCSVILDISTQDVFLLNATSDYIINELLEQKSIEKIINQYFSENQDTNHEIIYKDFVDIKNTLFEKGILYEH